MDWWRPPDALTSATTPKSPTSELYEQGYNRVYDTLEPETNLDDVEKVMSEVLEQWDPSEILCSYKLNHAIGEYLAEHAKGQRGILKSAFEKGVPVFVPAFTDSELGLDVALSNRMREAAGRHKLRFDPFEDLEHFASTLLRQKRLGIFTIGGGVPRNWSQQFGPFIELRHRRMGENVPLKRYHYGLRICPEPVYWGGLSGSPYSEAISWGKFVPPAEGGKFGEVFVDATVGLPLIVAAVLERLGKNGREPQSEEGEGTGEEVESARAGRPRDSRRDAGATQGQRPNRYSANGPFACLVSAI